MGKEAAASAEELTPPAGDDGDTPEGLVRSSAAMAVGTALSRLTGFLRVAAMAFALGVAESRLADSYNVANNIPNIVYELVLGGILTSVFVPVFVTQFARRSRTEALSSASAVMTVVVVVLGGITIAGILGAPWIVKLYTFRVPGPQRAQVQELAGFFLRFFMPQIFLYGMGAVATGLLNTHRRFAAPMFAPILNNAIVIATFMTFAVMPGPAEPIPGAITSAQRLVLAIGTTAGVVVMTFALWPTLRRIGFRWRWRLEWRNEAVRELISLSGWAVLYVVLNQLGLLVVIVLAGGVQGGYTAYQAAFIFFQLPYAIFSVSIMTALHPSLSADWARGDRADFRQDLARGVRASAFVVLPAAAGYLVLAEPIVRLLLQHGVAGAGSTALVSGVLTFFAIGLFPFSAFLLFLRAFYAMKDTRTPALINAVSVAVNTGANLILFPLLGVRGLALGHAIAYAVAATAAAVVLRRRLDGLEGRAVLRGIGRVVVASGATGGAAWAAATFLGRSIGVSSLVEQTIQVGGGVLIGLVTFVLAALALRIEEFELVKRTLLGRLRR